MAEIRDAVRQTLEETSQDRKTRTTGDFSATEYKLPIVGSRKAISLLDSFSSYLGTHNPFASEVNPATECVWLFENTAYKPVKLLPFQSQQWQAEFAVAYFKKNTGRDISKMVAQITEKVGLNEDGEDEIHTRKTIAERLQPFVDTIAPARMVQVVLPTSKVQTLGPGGPSAVGVQTITTLGEHKDGDTVSIPATSSEVTPYGPMKTHFAGPKGWAVISDIDDSIKITMTPSPIGILRSTFVSKPTPIPSMPALYSHIASVLSPTWFYLSASPYNLYPFLSSFLREHYPAGPILLRQASWMDLGGFLRSLTQGTETYKRARMEKIHEWLPQRKVLCVGDSTQSDPEAYGDICRKYKGWVKAVFIRKVVDVAEMDVSGKNEDKRFEKAFHGVDRGIWKIFTEPEELWEAVNALKDT